MEIHIHPNLLETTKNSSGSYQLNLIRQIPGVGFARETYQEYVLIGSDGLGRITAQL